MRQVKEWAAERCETYLAGEVDLSWRNGRALQVVVMEQSGVEKRLAAMEQSVARMRLAAMEQNGVKTQQASAEAAETSVLAKEASPASADPQQAAVCPVLAYYLSDAALYLLDFVGDCCGDECEESWMMVRL